ncbi:MAG: hypothetical protein KME30_19580 [Iphinoe sp. HA4291-MV1]|nr:hypothetical protein [Iphinoe sp. HA4291-MV1]
MHGAQCQRQSPDEWNLGGGSGHLGANLVRHLLADSHSIRVLLREGSNNTALDGLDIERVYGDLRDFLLLWLL